jgi:hypothetical protein
MSYQVVLQSEAIVDIQTAFDWYEQQRFAVRRISQEAIH